MHCCDGVSASNINTLSAVACGDGDLFIEAAAVLDQYNVDQRIEDIQVNILDTDS